MRSFTYEEDFDYLVEIIKDYPGSGLGPDFNLIIGEHDDYSMIFDRGEHKIGGDSPAWLLTTNLPVKIRRSLERAPVRLETVIGNITMPIMEGRMLSRVPSTSDDTSTDLIFGTPGSFLDKVKLRVPTSYSGRTPRAVLRDAIYRVRDYNRSRVEIPNFTSPLLYFTGEDQFVDEDSPKTILDAVAERLRFTQWDTMSDYGTRIMLDPGAGEGYPYAWEYDAQGPEVFRWNEPAWATPDEQYTSVIVRDRYEDGTLRILYEAPVSYAAFEYEPTADQPMYISWEAVGTTDADARTVAVQTAEALSRGGYRSEYEVAYNPLLEPFDVLIAHEEYEDQTGLYKRVWRQIVESLTNSIDDQGVKTKIGYRSYILSEERMPDPPIILPGISLGNAPTRLTMEQGLKPSDALKPYDGLKPTTTYYIRSGLKPHIYLKPHANLKPHDNVPEPQRQPA